jgi:alpha-1,2-mannosyltransferase
MLNKVRQQRPSYNNAASISSNVTVSKFKLAYYHCIAWLYGLAGAGAQVTMVNSSWTRGHIQSLWWGRIPQQRQQQQRHGDIPGNGVTQERRLTLVFPPCNTKLLQEIPLVRDVVDLSTPHTKLTTGRTSKKTTISSSASEQNGEEGKITSATSKKNMVLSIGQFRPEKDHALQIRAMHCLLSAQPSMRGRVELVVMGSVRHQEDEALLQGLRELAAELGLLDDGSVRFVANGSYAQLVEHMGRALVGVHTMWNEHFGISVVEMMAAGLVVIAHNSGGPKLDIIPHEGGTADLANGR